MKRFFYLLLCLFLSIGLVSAQTRQITGTVIGADDGESVIGASVVVKGAVNIGTVTDINGRFTLSVPTNATTLVVSFIGMTTQEVAISPNMRIVLSGDMQLLEEVVVTAFGLTRERKSLGYAVQDVKAEELTRANATTISSALQGKVSGVQIKPSSGMPGASAQIVIRGARSFTGDNTPLYVVDGMPVASSPTWGSGSGASGTDYSSRSMDIDPNDIESFTVLKGQAASALYGLRASNGVIVITTKSGKMAKGKPVISFSSSVTMDKVSRKPDYQTTWAQGGWDATTGRYAYQWQGASAWGPKITELPNEPGVGGNNPAGLTGNALAHYNNNKLTPQQVQGKYYVHQRALGGQDPWQLPEVYDNYGGFFLTGHTYNNAINVSQSTDRFNYSFGLSAANQEGIVPQSGMTRYNARGLVETQLSDKWRTGFSANYSNSYVSKVTSANDGALWALYAAPANYDINGIPYALPTDPYTQILFRASTFNNPYWAAYNNVNDETNNRFFGNGWLQFKPVISDDGSKNLSFRYQLGVDTYTNYAQANEEYGSRNGTGAINHSNRNYRNWNSTLLVNYDMTFANDFNFALTLGNEINTTNNKYVWLRGTVLNFGGWPHINNTNTRSGEEEKYRSRTFGLFGNAELSYKSMLFLNVSGRNDVVSTMPRGNRSFFYPSVSLGFVFTELEALKKQSLLSYGKVRASYAEVGMAGTYYENFYVAPGYGGGFWSTVPHQYPIGGVNSYIQSNTVYDPNLKPQNTLSYEVGADLRFFQNRIGVDYTFSYQNTRDQIFPVPLAGSTGKGTMMMNAGQMRTDVHELVLTAVPVQTRDLRWSINLNFSKMVNTVVKLAPGVEDIMLGGFTTPQVRAAVGYNYPVLFGEIYEKDDKGRILVDENAKLPSGAANPNYGFPMVGKFASLGSAQPDFILGGTSTLAWKSFTLGGTFEWKNGGLMYSGTNGLMKSSNGLDKSTLDRTSTFVYDGYKKDGTKNDIVRGGPGDERAYLSLAERNSAIMEFYIFDSSFLKLREISLAYKLPKLHNAFNSFDITCSVFARNLLLWTNYPNLDPESSQGNNNMGGTFERFSVPQTKSFGLGVNITF